jgi:hypothetical protein
MDKQQKFAYWLDVAEYDLKTADAMMDSGNSDLFTDNPFVNEIIATGKELLF